MKARLVAGIAAIVIGLTGCSSTGGAPTATPTTTIVATPTTTVVATPRAPEPADFRIDVIVTGKQCFSPANCVYHYTIDPWPTATFPPQPDGRKLTVIYTVTGGDQEQIGNYTIDYASDLPEGETRLFRDTDAVVIGPDGATFTATVTRVMVNG